jgi:hypothetical protein
MLVVMCIGDWFNFFCSISMYLVVVRKCLLLCVLETGLVFSVPSLCPRSGKENACCYVYCRLVSFFLCHLYVLARGNKMIVMFSPLCQIAYNC